MQHFCLMKKMRNFIPEEDHVDEEYIPPEFSNTDEDENQEDLDNGVFETEDEDKHVMMYDIDNPSIGEGVVFPSAVDCRNAVATFSVSTETEYITLKSDQRRFTVKCASDRLEPAVVDEFHDGKLGVHIFSSSSGLSHGGCRSVLHKLSHSLFFSTSELEEDEGMDISKKKQEDKEFEATMVAFAMDVASSSVTLPYASRKLHLVT
ncbi:hypothetical protein D1007_62555 [Hordeum vulgare]|nr:hypothetical protein D1007_62555 [Hordeum vulgare]